METTGGSVLPDNASVHMSDWCLAPPAHTTKDNKNNDTQGDVWCNGQHICFRSLPPMLLCRFKSRLGLEPSGFSMWHFLKLVTRGFLRALRFPPLLHRFNPLLGATWLFVYFLQGRLGRAAIIT